MTVALDDSHQIHSQAVQVRRSALPPLARNGVSDAQACVGVVSHLLREHTPRWSRWQKETGAEVWRVVVNGFAQGLVCVTRHLVQVHGEPAVAVEDPGSTGTVEQLSAWGARVIPIPVDAAGLDVDALERSDAVAIVVTAAHQYPTGVTLAPDRRHALIAWARRRDALIIEDDYDAEYRYDRAPLTSLHNLEPDRIIAAGSTSKSLSPALRLGWLAVPARLADALTEIKASIDLGAPTLPQAALAHFIATGGLDRHIRRTRSVCRRRRDALVDALRAHAPGLQLGGIAAGLHVLVRLGDDVDEDDLAERARRLGLDAQPLGRYRHGPGQHRGRQGLVVGYARLPPHRLDQAVADLFAPPDPGGDRSRSAEV